MFKFLIFFLFLEVTLGHSDLKSDIDTLITKYTSNKKFQIDTFITNFVRTLNDDSNCLNTSLFNRTLNHVSNRHDFAVLSSFLVSNLDKCYHREFKLDSVEPKQIEENETITNFMDTYVKSFYKNAKNIQKETWFYSLVSVTIISFVGVLCIVVVPVLNTFCFNYLFQFLTALALGTLTGDALLHLIPHAYMNHSHDDSITENGSHDEEIYKGLAVVVGIYVFFLIESIMKIRQAKKLKAEKKKANQKRQNDRLSKQYELEHLIENPHRLNPRLRESVKSKAASEFSYYDNDLVRPDRGHEFTYLRDEKRVVKKSSKKSHGHSHADVTKSSILMIIIGDGLHNFSDGLAIGVSFASSLTTGFGTSLAVFFHELPHEIGDFAVLRKNGYSMRRALLLNILSSFLCFLGAFVGLLIGSIEKFSNWSFLFIAGSFLYISLVDIIPELNECKEEGKFLIFLMQNLGIILGFGLMLAIALFENDIVKMIQ